MEGSPRSRKLGKFRAWLRASWLVQKALTTPVDPALRQPPSARTVTGLVLLGASYLLGWPAMALLGVVAAWLRRPILLVGGPVLYGFSWLVFLVGLVFLGSKSLGTGRAFGLLVVRKLAERFLEDRG
jgi:hypothetical protein